MNTTIWCGLQPIILVYLAAAPLVSVADASVPPPEVKKTVDALTGRWILTGTDAEPGVSAPTSAKATIDCKPASLGMAAICIISAQVGDALIEAAAVVGYDPDEGEVRWMEISSTGEYHDHHGLWNSHEIHFKPLTYTSGGVKLTENFAIGFPSPGKMVFQAITESPGGKSVIELKGSKNSARMR